MDKIWWNEQWMGWPLGPQYAASSNIEHAKNLKGRLHCSCPRSTRTWTRVDDAGGQCAGAGRQGIRARRHPGADHGAGSPITARKRNDFFVKWLRGIDPPNWNDVPVNRAAATVSTTSCSRGLTARTGACSRPRRAITRVVYFLVASTRFGSRRQMFVGVAASHRD
jgi:hypothetical protein